MPKRKVVKEEVTYSQDEPEPTSGGASESKHDPTTSDVMKDEALRSKWAFIAAKNQQALDEITKKQAKAQNSGDDDGMAQLNKELLATLRTQVQIKTMMKMLDDGDKKDGHSSSAIDSLRSELSETMKYLYQRLDSMERSKGEDRTAQMQQQQFQMMLAMMQGTMNKQDPNAGLTQQLILKMMDGRTGVKDILPIMAQMQQFSSQQNADIEKTRMGIMQEVILHALTAGERDWGDMSLPEKAQFLMGIMGKAGAAVMEKVDEFRARKYEKKGEKTERVEGPEKKIGLGLAPKPAANQTTPESPIGGEKPTAADAQISAQPQGPTQDPESDIQQAIADRVNLILKAVEREIRIGSDPGVIYEELERVYFGLPVAMRDQIESADDPMMLVKAVEPYADKQLLERIVKMAIEDKAKAEWLKSFHECLIGDDGDDDPDENEFGTKSGGDPEPQKGE